MSSRLIDPREVWVPELQHVQTKFSWPRGHSGHNSGLAYFGLRGHFLQVSHVYNVKEVGKWLRKYAWRNEPKRAFATPIALALNKEWTDLGSISLVVRIRPRQLLQHFLSRRRSAMFIYQWLVSIELQEASSIIQLSKKEKRRALSSMFWA